MITFINNNRNVIGILSVWLVFGVWSNAANALDGVWSNAANALETNTENNLLSITTVVQQETPEATKVALSVSKEERLQKYANATSLSDRELKEMLSLVGFSGLALKKAWAVAKKESNGRPLAFNGNKSTGDSSFGIFQINMIGMLGPERRDKFELVSNSDLLNPVINAEIAYHMSKGGEDWSSWKGMTPRTKEWIARFPN
jgi:hypothetical protein